jgi:hypothetical protein
VNEKGEGQYTPDQRVQNQCALFRPHLNSVNNTCSAAVPPPNELRAEFSDIAIIQESVRVPQNIL